MDGRLNASRFCLRGMVTLLLDPVTDPETNITRWLCTIDSRVCISQVSQIGVGGQFPCVCPMLTIMPRASTRDAPTVGAPNRPNILMQVLGIRGVVQRTWSRGILGTRD